MGRIKIVELDGKRWNVTIIHDTF